MNFSPLQLRKPALAALGERAENLFRDHHYRECTQVMRQFAEGVLRTILKDDRHTYSEMMRTPLVRQLADSLTFEYFRRIRDLGNEASHFRLGTSGTMLETGERHYRVRTADDAAECLKYGHGIAVWLMSLLDREFRYPDFRPLTPPKARIAAQGAPVVFNPDQQAAIELSQGRHLVLAPPGCGKTAILTERIAVALKDGVNLSDMLCLTFTNRAARGMKERIDERFTDRCMDTLYVGNLHRFCSRLLFDNDVVSEISTILDEDDVHDVIEGLFIENIHGGCRGRSLPGNAADYIMARSARLFQEANGFPEETFHRTPEFDVNKKNQDELDAFGLIKVDDFGRCIELDHAAIDAAARRYLEYKTAQHLLDFNDLLLKAWAWLDATPEACGRYAWIQVDEVQDLSPLQLDIVKKLWNDSIDRSVCVYFGDEQQAIFSFMGAKLSTLKILKERCKGNIHHLNVNHRQPQQIVQMLNDYAIANLHSDAALLPSPTEDKDNKGVEMQICSTENIWAEYKSVAKRTKSLLKEANTTTAIIVNSNRDADEISNNLEAAGIPHFKISGTDLFSTPELKLLTAHLSVLNNELNNLAWAQIMQGMKVCGSAATARQFVHRLRKVAIAPTDLLHKDDTYLEQFLHTYENSDLIVFDTETTGLNVYDDDIIQIAAERIHQGKSVAKFSVYLQTDRSIPKMLGDIENPIIEERRHNELLTPAEGLQAFLGFAKGCPLLAHNASFDYHIMDFCIQRYLPGTDWQVLYPVCFDSLKLIRLLRPDLKVYKLKALLAELGLQGENSHLADDDVNATVSLVNYCYTKGMEMKPAQDAFLQLPNTKKMAERLRRNYGADYEEAVNKLYLRPTSKSEDKTPALVEELQRFYNSLLDGKWIKPIEKISYVFSFLTEDVIHPDEEPSLKEQLDNHIMEISTFKEADLCGSTAIKERVFVSTIHKAKGLEFDNVIVFDVVDGRIPNFHSENNPRLLEEDARKLYVALSRAKKRIYVYYSKNPPTTNIQRTQKLSRFMKPVMKYFTR